MVSKFVSVSWIIKRKERKEDPLPLSNPRLPRCWKSKTQSTILCCSAAEKTPSWSSRPSRTLTHLPPTLSMCLKSFFLFTRDNIMASLCSLGSSCSCSCSFSCCRWCRLRSPSPPMIAEKAPQTEAGEEDEEDEQEDSPKNKENQQAVPINTSDKKQLLREHRKQREQNPQWENFSEVLGEHGYIPLWY